MSGIVGIWNLDGRAVDRETLVDMSATLAHRGLDGQYVWLSGPIGLACQLSRVTPEATEERQPHLNTSGNALVFDGRLDDRRDLVANLQATQPVSWSSPDPEVALAAYELFGDSFAERLTGDFALGLFDPDRQILIVARDAIGIRPLYYSQIAGSFLFASEIKALLAHPAVNPRPNDDALASVLFNGGRGLNGATCFEGIFRLAPGHVGMVTRARFTISRYWDFDLSRRMRLGSPQEYVEVFGDLFERAVARRMRSSHDVAISVSGGLDSSSILCMGETLRRRRPLQHPNLLGISYISPAGSPSDEKAFLVEIEQKYGIDIEKIPVSFDGPFEGSQAAVRHIEVPFLDEAWDTTRSLQLSASQGGARLLLSGHWADEVLCPQAYLVDLTRRFAFREINRHLQEYRQWYAGIDPAHYRRRFLLDLAKYHVARSCSAVSPRNSLSTSAYLVSKRFPAACPPTRVSTDARW